MRIAILLFATFLYTSLSYSQKDTPFDPRDSIQTTIVLKAMVLPYFIGNSGGLSNMAGIDVGFLKRHSVGIEYIYNMYESSEDEVTDKNGVYHEVGNAMCSNQRGFIVNYRYYLGLSHFRDRSGLTFYISPFMRLAHKETYQDRNYTKNDFYFERDRQRSAGIMLGSLINIKNVNNLAFDCNVGGFYKTRTITSDYLDNNIAKHRTTNRAGYNIWIGLSLNYWLDL